MEKKIVTFKGISNVPDDGFNEAGDMAVLMNMRHKGGELVPCGKPEVGEGVKDVKLAVYHPDSGYWLVLTGNTLYVKDKDMNNVGGYITSGVESFALMGNVVTIYKVNSVEYAIWRAGEFKHLGEMPVCEGLVSVAVGTNLFEKVDKHDDLAGAEDAEAMGAAQVGAIDKSLDAIYHEKGFVDRAWFRAAYRLFDGTYIKASQIVQVSWYGDGKFSKLNTGEACPGSDNTPSQMFYIGTDLVPRTSVHYFKPTIGLTVPAISEWKDIIVGIDIFTTGSLMSFGVKQVVVGNSVVEKYATLNEVEFKEKLVNAEFYRYASYDIRGNKEFEVDNTSPSNLAVQTVLTLQDQAVYIAKESSSYNFKQHIFDYKKRLFKGYRLPKSLNAMGENDFWSADITALYVIIETEEGKKVVKSEPYEVGGKVFGYFSYPDSRASKIIVQYNDGTQKLVELTPHPHRNEAYCVYVRMKQGGNGTVPVIINPESNVTTQVYTVDNIETAKNILKVSAVDNPFYFPTAQTYKFEGEIKGLASNAEAISTGQFGQYPLFVFTDTGIWAMSVDTSGQGAYTTQSPFSREVCNGAICPVSGGVVFSTDKGVMVISGGQVADLSAALDGFEVDFFAYNSEMWQAIFAKAGKDDVVNPVPIRQYIKGAVIAYNYHYNEIILSNKAKDYSYVYSLTNQVWSVIDTVFDLTTNKYPELVVFDKNGGKMYTFGDGEAQNNVVAITRPFTMGSLDFKRIRQAGLRTTYEGQLNFYVLGSVDGANFVCITGKEYDAGRNESEVQRDLITAMSRSKQYKYFAIAIAGNIKGRVSMAELLVDMGFANNKIR